MTSSSDKYTHTPVAVSKDRSAEGRRLLVVADTCQEAAGVMGLTLASPTGGELAPWSPGSHVEVELPSGLRRQYSLCGDPGDRSTYAIAVARAAESRGGSAEVHETDLLGRSVAVSSPRNNFPLERASRYCFIAGGIGITPIAPMLRAVERSGEPWALVYGGRSIAAMALRDQIAQRKGGEVHLFPEDVAGPIPVDDVVRTLGHRSHVYCCGPAGLIDAVEDTVARQSAPVVLHVERFSGRDNGARPRADAITPRQGQREPSQVHLERAGLTLDVAPDQTLLSAIRAVLPGVAFSCGEGACGTCETSILEGRVEHNDSVLTPEERASGNTVMICVGRPASRRLVLDL